MKLRYKDAYFRSRLISQLLLQPRFIYQYKLLYFYTMSELDIKAILSKINWDTPHSNDDLYRIFTGAISHIGGIDKKWIYLRILNSFNWYTVLKIIPKNELHFLLSDEIINNLFPRHLRIKYKHVRSALFE